MINKVRRTFPAHAAGDLHGPGLQRHADERGHHQNVNGQAITLALKPRTTATPRTGRASSSRSRSNFQHAQLPVALLPGRGGFEPRHRRAAARGATGEMVANLRAGNIDGFLGPDPFNQRAVFEEVGFIHLPGTCGTATPAAPSAPAPSSSEEPQHLCRAVPRRCSPLRPPWRAARKNRELIAKVIAPQGHLNQPGR